MDLNWETVYCYLRNQGNVSDTMEELHIARTTCLYRIHRAEEIGHLNLNDEDTLLYLLMLSRMDRTHTE